MPDNELRDETQPDPPPTEANPTRILRRRPASKNETEALHTAAAIATCLYALRKLRTARLLPPPVLMEAALPAVSAIKTLMLQRAMTEGVARIPAVECSAYESGGPRRGTADATIELAQFARMVCESKDGHGAPRLIGDRVFSLDLQAFASSMIEFIVCRQPSKLPAESLLELVNDIRDKMAEQLFP